MSHSAASHSAAFHSVASHSAVCLTLLPLTVLSFALLPLTLLPLTLLSLTVSSWIRSADNPEGHVRDNSATLKLLVKIQEGIENVWLNAPDPETRSKAVLAHEVRAHEVLDALCCLWCLMHCAASHCVVHHAAFMHYATNPSLDTSHLVLSQEPLCVCLLLLPYRFPTSHSVPVFSPCVPPPLPVRLIVHPPQSN